MVLVNHAVMAPSPSYGQAAQWLQGTWEQWPGETETAVRLRVHQMVQPWAELRQLDGGENVQGWCVELKEWVQGWAGRGCG